MRWPLDDDHRRREALLAHMDWSESLRNARARPVVCTPCERAQHHSCVRPCTCAGARHGRVVAHTA